MRRLSTKLFTDKQVPLKKSLLIVHVKRYIQNDKVYDIRFEIVIII